MTNSEPKVRTLGPPGEVLRANLRRIRQGQRLTYIALSRHLTDLGRPIHVLGLRRIEIGARRVDVDDLLALACALGVAVVDLLVPGDSADEAEYQVAINAPSTVAVARRWISGNAFLVEPETAVELANAVRWMPVERADEHLRRWSA